MTGQRQDTSGKIEDQLWVLQVVGSNPAAPTNKINHLVAIFQAKSSQKSGLGRLCEDDEKYFWGRARSTPRQANQLDVAGWLWSDRYLGVDRRNQQTVVGACDDDLFKRCHFPAQRAGAWRE